MEPIIENHITKSISSQQMESSEIQKQIINLGKLLVKELKLEPGVDTLQRWMAHYIAELIAKIETATNDNKVEIEQRCFETVLKLWQHRFVLPHESRPFKKFEPIFRGLERLDPENKQPYYFNHFKEPSLVPVSDSVNNVQKWIDAALNMDRTVRIFIDFFFEQAALSAIDEKTKEWLTHSYDLPNNDDSLVIELLLKESIFDEETANILEKGKREKIENRIEELERFNELSKNLISVYKKELEGKQSPSKDNGV